MESPKLNAGQKIVIFGQSISAFGCLLTILVPVCLIGMCLVIGLFAEEPTLITADDYVNEYGGSVELYGYILTLNDCSLLQEQFDLASANNERETPGTSAFKMTMGYMKAADDRMKAMGCYEGSQSPSRAVVESVNSPIPQLSNSPVPTELPASSIDATITPFVLPTLTKPAGAVIYISPTPINTIVFIMPTRAPTRIGEAPPPVQSVNCSCQFDTLNCENFSDWYDAQSCMDKCVSMGKGDIYRLDHDNDGIACENN